MHGFCGIRVISQFEIIFLIFVLLFIPARQWKWMSLFMISFLFFFFLPTLYFPWPVYQAFFQMAHHYILFIERAMLPMNGSLLGVVTNVVRLWHPASTTMQIRVCTIILCLYVLVRWIIYDNNQLRHFSSYSKELRFSFLIVLALICSPLGWEYYFLFLIIPVVVMLEISGRYALSVLFYIFFTAAMIFPYFGWMDKTNGFAYIVQSFCVFLALIFFLVALISAARSVHRAQPPVFNQAYCIIGILSVCVLINVILILFNYGMPYFLDITEKSYLQHVGAIMQWHRN